MSTLETGNKLVEFCKQNKNMEAIDSLYSQDIVSLEPRSTAEAPAEVHGLEAIRGKNQWWIDNQKINSSSIEGPFVNGDRFSVNFKYNVTGKKDGKSMDMKEIGLYTVRDDKIIREEFYQMSEAK